MDKKNLWFYALALLAVVAGIGLSLKPWRIYAQQKELAGNAASEMRQAEANRASLTRTKARYESPVGREELAREQGYTKPGEVPLKSQGTPP